jgi:hypothetical protein
MASAVVSQFYRRNGDDRRLDLINLRAESTHVANLRQRRKCARQDSEPLATSEASRRASGRTGAAQPPAVRVVCARRT